MGPLTSLTGKSALVTGATSGLGLHIAAALASRGAYLLVGARNEKRGLRALDAITTRFPGARGEVVPLDLARLSSVRDLAQRLAERGVPDLSVINAGVVMLADRQRHLTSDQFELHYQTNFLSHAYLMEQVPSPVTIVQTSLAAAFTKPQWNDPQSECRYSAMKAYANSKLMLSLYALGLARTSSRSVALAHPGIVPGTHIAEPIRTLFPEEVVRLVTRRMGNSPAKGALPTLMAIADQSRQGRMYAPKTLGIQGNPIRRDPFAVMKNTQDQQRVADLVAGLSPRLA